MERQGAGGPHGLIADTRGRDDGSSRFDSFRVPSPPSLQTFQHDGTIEENDVVRSLAAQAQGARLRVFRALVIAGPRGMTPGVMAEGSGISSRPQCCPSN